MRLGLGIGLNRLRRGAGGSPPPPAFTPADLFTASEAGFWAPVTMSRLWQDTARTTPVTATGQSVASWELTTASGVIYAEQGTGANQPIYRENVNGRGYLDFDAANDALIIPLVTTGVWDFAMSYATRARNFIAFHRNGTVGHWFGAGVSGNPSTTLADGNVSPLARYWNNVLSTNTTLAQEYTSAQSASRLFINASSAASATNARIGFYAADRTTPGDVYGLVYREGTMDATQRANLDTWMAALQNP